MKNTFAIRGATTVEMDSPAQVDEAVCELFDRVLEENSLAVEDIAFILLSQTHDIRTRNAATSLRKTGKVATRVLPSPVAISAILPLCNTTPPNNCTS